MTCLPELPELAEVLSPSQLRCFMDCQARWWFKYDLRYPDPPTGEFALGRAVHAALAQNFEQKIETYEDLPIPGVAARSARLGPLNASRPSFATRKIRRNSPYAAKTSFVKTSTKLLPRLSRRRSSCTSRAKSPASSFKAGSTCST